MGRTSDADKRLKDAALELIWEESYGGTSIDDICGRAGVKKGSFYYFFESKADLAVAAMEEAWEKEWKPELDKEFSSSIDPLVRLTAHLESIYIEQIQVKQDHGKVLGCPLCSVGSEISTQEVDVNAKVREICSRRRRYLESAIRDAVADGSIEPCDPVQKAVALSALIDGIMSQARIMNDPEVARELPAMGLGLLGVRRSVPAPSAATS